jgi:REP element-mobilizing transposase RayT
MARALRPHLPGVPFHLTARLQGRAPLFCGVEHTVARLLGEHSAEAGGDLLAYVVMPNHLHAVFVQGTLPLSRFMQPLLRRLAILVHSRHRSEGHAFQRRFFSTPCTDPEYLRNSIMYVHLNPVRAGYCREPGQYSWSSHLSYGAVTRWAHTGPACGLRLFAAERASSPCEAHSNYRAFLEWRVGMDALLGRSRCKSASEILERPGTMAGDEYWVDRFGWPCTGGAEHQVPRRRPVIDLRDLALRLTRACDPPMDLDLLRSGKRTRSLVSFRRDFIVQARSRGHRNRAIARFLNVSDATVSRS